MKEKMKNGAGATSRKPVEPGKKKAKDIASTAGTEYVVYVHGGQTLTIRQ